MAAIPIPKNLQRDLGSVDAPKGQAESGQPGPGPVVAKKKKKSALKKLIVAEKEVRCQDGARLPSALAAQPVEGTVQVDAPSDVVSVDAPEFVPTGWVSNAPAAESVAETTGLSQRKEEESRRKGPAMARKAADFVPSWVQAAEFVPSWCNQPEPGDDAAAPAGAIGSSQAAVSTEGPEDEELAVSKAIERMEAQKKDDRGKGSREAKKEKKPPQTTNLEVRHYVRQVLSDELDEKVKAMLGDLARFQERARADPLKFAKLKRFCVGMSEATRSVKRGKAKCLIVAPNLDRSEADGGLDDTVENLMDCCSENEVPIIFALSRNRMGKAIGKNIRMSIVCVLSAEGVHQECRQIIKLSEELRRQWVMRRMALGAHVSEAEAADAQNPGETADEVAPPEDSMNERVLRHLEEQRLEAERIRAEEKAVRDVERAEAKARKQAERQAKQEERRAAHALEKEAEDAKEEEEARLKEEAEVEKRKIAAVKEAARQELIEKARQEKERKAEEERRRIAEQDEKARAAAGIDDDDSSDDDNLPAGFNADFF